MTIKKLVYEGEIRLMNKNYHYNYLLKNLKNDKREFHVGVFISGEYSADKSVVTWCSKNKYGKVIFVGSELICENGECGKYRRVNGGCPVCHDPCF